MNRRKFERFAKENGLPLERLENDKRYASLETEWAWRGFCEAKSDSASRPHGVYQFIPGVDYPNVSGGENYVSGISTTVVREELGGAKEDLDWSNRIECYGKTKRQAVMLRDYVLQQLRHKGKGEHDETDQ